jgi:hypothetical protein
MTEMLTESAANKTSTPKQMRKDAIGTPHSDWAAS